MRRHAVMLGDKYDMRISEISVVHSMNVIYRNSNLEFVDAASNRTLCDRT